MNTCTKCGAPYVTAFPEDRTLCPKCQSRKSEVSLLFRLIFWVAFALALYTILR